MIDYNSLRERELLKLYYGWNSATTILSEIGELLQVSPERVRQIQYTALRKLFNCKWGRTRGRQYIEEIVGLYRYTYREVENKMDLDKYFKEIDMKFDNIFNS